MLLEHLTNIQLTVCWLYVSFNSCSLEEVQFWNRNGVPWLSRCQFIIIMLIITTTTIWLMMSVIRGLLMSKHPEYWVTLSAEPKSLIVWSVRFRCQEGQSGSPVTDTENWWLGLTWKQPPPLNLMSAGKLRTDFITWPPSIWVELKSAYLDVV